MKKPICLKPVLLFYSILFYLPTIAQLKANAGEDQVICICDTRNEFEIGGSPTALGGVEPYIYKWSGNAWMTEPENILTSVTNDLDNPAKSNPILHFSNPNYEWSEFYLKVEDAVGSVDYDTVTFYNANVWHQLFFDSYNIIKRGDSIQLTGPFFRNEYLPLAYSITPSIGLTDSTDIYGWTKPDSSITYYIQAENSFGCISPKVRYMNIKVVDSKTDSIYHAKIDSLNHLLIGEWEWYGSGGAWGGFGGPEENGYRVKIVIEQDLSSDSLLFLDYVNDTLVNQGKTKLHFFNNSTSAFELYSPLPEIHYYRIGSDYPFGPQFPERMMINIDFFNKDSVRYYSTRMVDVPDVYYKRMEKTGIKQLTLAEQKIRFYPNPAKNSITVSNPLNIKIKKIEIIDLSGLVAKKWDKWEPGETTLKIESFKPGIYLLKIETEFGILTEKLVVR